MMRGQSHRMSVIESCVNTFGGFGIALACQIAIFPWFGIIIPISSSIGIAVLMMIQSMVRQYSFRRFFNWLHIREHIHAETKAREARGKSHP